MKLNRLITVAATAVLALTVSACAAGGGNGGGGNAPTHDKTLRIGTMTMPQSLDPVDAIGSAVPFYQATYDSLILRKPDGSFAPMLATEWSYNPELTVLTLKLRTDVKFDDGSALDAAAVKANLERFRDGTGSNAAFLKGTKIDVVDPSTVTITLEKTDPALVFYLSDSAGFIANPAKFGQADALKTTADGTGPYVLNAKETAIGTTWSYDKRENYWGAKDLKLDFDKITFQGFDNENAIVNGLKTGQLDTALLQDADQQLAAEQDKKITLQDAPFDFQGLLLFDRGGALTPALANTKVRQALNYALDRETLLSVVRGGRGEATSQVWGTSSQGYEKSLDTYYAHDPAKAKALLAEAGYPNGFDLVLPKLTTIVTDGIATAIQTDFAAVGVKVIWQDVDQTTALKQIFRNREFSAMVMNMGQSSSDWIVYSSLIAPGTFNFFGTVNEKMTELAAKARVTPESESAPIYKELNKLVVEEAWFVPFYRIGYSLATVPGVKAEKQSGMAVPSIYNYSLEG